MQVVREKISKDLVPKVDIAVTSQLAADRKRCQGYQSNITATSATLRKREGGRGGRAEGRT